VTRRLFRLKAGTDAKGEGRSALGKEALNPERKKEIFFGPKTETGGVRPAGEKKKDQIVSVGEGGGY